MKRVYLNGFNNIALIIDDERKKYALCKETTARHIKKDKNTGVYCVKLERISELLKAIKKDSYINIRG